ncbi:ABC transporter permease [Tumebacillus lipolyticus]|uniref:ABC transporter permease n=1 Tax=Tumebacillus lipolyticus TaxID=1280370 RepID=A0ABW4ZVY9_9BACL
MLAFRRLVKTDLRNRRNTIFVTLGTIVLLNAVLALLPALFNIPQDGLQFVLSLNIAVFVAVLLIPLLNCFSVWREEWKHRTIYHLLSLPVSRAQLLLAKYISIFVEALLIAAIMLIGLSIQNWLSEGLLFRAEPLIAFNWSNILFVGGLLLFTTCLIFLCFFSSLLGKCFKRYSLLMTFFIFLVGLTASILALSNLLISLLLILVCLLLFWGSLGSFLGKYFRKHSLLMTFFIFLVGLFASILALSSNLTSLVILLLCLLFFGGSLYLLERRVGVE